MNQYAFYIEDLLHYVTEVNGSPITPVQCVNYPNIDPTFFLAQELPAPGQPDYTDLCVTSNTNMTLLIKRADGSTYPLSSNIFNGPRPPHRPF